MPTRNARLYSIALIFGDILTLLAAFTLAYVVRVQFDPRPLVAQIHGIDFIYSSMALIPFWILAFATLGLYSSKIYARRLAEIGRLFIGCIIGILIILGYAFVMDEPVFPARLVAVYAFIGSFVSLVVAREIIRQVRTLLFRYGRGVSRVLIIGTTEAVADIAMQLDDTRKSGYHIVAIAGPKRILPPMFEGRHFNKAEDALDHLKDMRITTIVQTDLYDSIERNQMIMGAAQSNHIGYNFIPGEPEFYSGKNTVDVFLGYPIIAVHQTPLVGWGEVVKRLFDVIIVSLLLVLLSPIFLLIAILQKIFNPGPIFFISQRLTRYATPFGIYKFRTMSTKYGTKDAAEDFRDMGREDLALEYEKNRKVVNDPRITPFGKFLRATSLDELPQFFNVLRGELSLVGPRPILPQELPLYKGRGALLHSVKSGVTGLWQVSGRSNLAFDKRVELELYYAQNWSFWLDIKILLKTIPALFKKGSAR
ncbi:MAG TPA: sugar transferase [Candidatus Saccharimonadales bacterium]|nr:sugar transferase [Candidatus Saccharimonadales bacterium]